MNGGVYFDGDPATESARRHMERVLKGEPKRRWPWLLAALGGGAVWTLYRAGKTAAENRGVPSPGTGTGDGSPGKKSEDR